MLSLTLFFITDINIVLVVTKNGYSVKFFLFLERGLRSKNKKTDVATFFPK